MDLLMSAAKAWQTLLNIEYEITYGRKKNLYTVRLVFSLTDFYHNAGFQYMDDIQLPYITSHQNTLSSVLDKKISFEMIRKCVKFNTMIEPRLIAIAELPSMLDGECKIFIFNKKTLPFYSKIDAKYLISGNSGNIVFLFTDAENNRFFPRSVFVMDSERDYRKNQIPLTILKKTRVSMADNTNTILYIKDGFEG